MTNLTLAQVKEFETLQAAALTARGKRDSAVRAVAEYSQSKPKGMGMALLHESVNDANATLLAVAEELITWLESHDVAAALKPAPPIGVKKRGI